MFVRDCFYYCIDCKTFSILIPSVHCIICIYIIIYRNIIPFSKYLEISAIIERIYFKNYESLYIYGYIVEKLL